MVAAHEGAPLVGSARLVHGGDDVGVGDHRARRRQGDGVVLGAALLRDQRLLSRTAVDVERPPASRSMLAQSAPRSSGVAASAAQPSTRSSGTAPDPGPHVVRRVVRRRLGGQPVQQRRGRRAAGAGAARRPGRGAKPRAAGERQVVGVARAPAGRRRSGQATSADSTRAAARARDRASRCGQHARADPRAPLVRADVDPDLGGVEVVEQRGRTSMPAPTTVAVEQRRRTARASDRSVGSRSSDRSAPAASRPSPRPRGRAAGEASVHGVPGGQRVVVERVDVDDLEPPPPAAHRAALTRPSSHTGPSDS